MVETIPFLIEMKSLDNDIFTISAKYKNKLFVTFKIIFNEYIDEDLFKIKASININSLNWKELLIKEVVRNIKKYLNLTIHKIMLV